MSAVGPIAVVLAAGKGTRMNSRRPKVLFEVLGRPIVQRVVDTARDAGCAEVVVVVGYEADQVKGVLSGVRFALQPGVQGTGQAVQAAASQLDARGRSVLVLPGDVPMMTAATLRSLIEGHSGAITIASMEPTSPTGYGRIVRGEGGEVLRIVEERDATESERTIREVNSAIYVFDGDFLFGNDESPGAVFELGTDNEQNEYLLTDVVGIAAARGLPVGASLLPDPQEVAGVNDRAQLATLESAMRQRINQAWLESGVSMDDPATTRIEEGVVLSSDVHLGAGVELRGRTTVGEGSSVGKGSVLTDCSLGSCCTVGAYVLATSADLADGAEVRPFSLLSGLNEKQPAKSVAADKVTLGAGARVGPFSHLRQSSELGDRARVGNFVEIKKTTLHEEAKANHLAYLGDAEVGARSNIGAGVITCNYDGFAKHKTTIGEDVFVGTDSHLVAPVRLGDGAFVGTGTTVTRDVPADCLAIGRARQENKEGYASRMKASLERRAESARAREAKAAAAAQSTTDSEQS